MIDIVRHTPYDREIGGGEVIEIDLGGWTACDTLRTVPVPVGLIGVQGNAVEGVTTALVKCTLERRINRGVDLGRVFVARLANLNGQKVEWLCLKRCDAGNAVLMHGDKLAWFDTALSAKRAAAMLEGVEYGLLVGQCYWKAL